MPTVEELLYGLGATIHELNHNVKFLGENIKEQRPRESRDPVFIARTLDQMENELRERGRLYKPEAGLQDDFANALSMFTQLSEDGRLVPGLVGARGPASLMELYQTMDLRGVIWNYGLGWLSALKGGFNQAIDSGRTNAKKIIGVTKAETRVNPSELLEYLKSSDALENYYKTREFRKADDLEAFYKIRKSVSGGHINEEKYKEKQAYYNLLKTMNDIKELKSQQAKPLKSTKDAWKEYISYKVVV